ncbi:SHOCT domain-containing protein [Paractinoplanes toevensis]|uniref:Membrane protein n=1 Tax=Paractinoplanes toevensis TaxID=571911 RepID=A0A919W7M8_9ACTN|nr:SHOCT domain-containing protein [Actinoplanes toevensis]GIM89586.1 membrane protein [Actinoplanes toevensis]
MFDDNGSFLLAVFEFFIFCAWFMCLFWIFGDLFRSRDIGGWGKTLWTIFLVFLPLLGMLIYLIARGSGMNERAAASAAGMQKRQEAYIRSVAAPSNGRRTPTEEIASAKTLLDSGAINAAEFERLKADALTSGAASPVA